MSPELHIPEGFGCRFGRQYRATDARPMAYGLQPNRTTTSGFDAFTNAAARMGWGTPSVAEGADYNLVRLSYDYWLLITLYRNHWISRRIVDGPAQDMVRAWPKLSSDIAPDDLSRIDKAVRKTATRAQVLKTLKWARLFGGAGALIMIDGQENELDQPLDLDSIEPGAYLGLDPFDRWSGIHPSATVCTDITKPLEFNLPEFYEIHSPSGGDSYRVHPSRILRFSGPDVPAPEHQAQQYWGISVLEPAYEEIRKRDNMSWNLLSLSFRASIIAMRNKDLAQMLSGAGMNTKALQGFHSRMEAVNQLLSSQNLMVLPDEGGLEQINYTPSGWDAIYGMFQMDVAGASGYTVTRLFGRTITGIGQSNDADERLYEERIAMEQDDSLRPQLEKLYPVICMSALGEVPEDLDFTFPSVRVLTEEEKSKLSSDTMASLVALGNAGYLTKPQVLKEIKQQSDVTGFGTNVTDEDIEAAERDEDMGLGGLGEMAGGWPETEPSPDTPGGAPTQAADEWSESDHPREKGGENGGQFTSGSGGGSSAPAKGQGALAPAPADRKKWPEHIKSLKLPPAWTDVRVSDDPKADLLAVGKDAKGRSQYVYSERFQNSQAEAKFARIKELDSKFGSIRKQNKSLQQSSAAREKDNADCAALIMAMGIRPGSESDTKAKVKAYGATTLEGRHVVEKGGAVYLEFTGKKGVAISLPVGDPKLAESLKERASRAGQGGKLFPNASEKTLLNHTHTLDGGGFKTKDFRTLLATRWASEQVKLGQPPKNEREYKKRVLDVAKHVSAKLGNTPTVALQSYINPAVFAPWRSAIAA